MKLRTIALSLAILCASSTSFAGMVSTSSNLEFLAIDGQKASKALLKETKSFNINDTETQQVVVRLGDIVGSGSNQSLFESSPIIVTFKGSPEDITISSPSIRSRSEGEKFNSTPTINITSKSGNTIAAKVDVLKQEGLFPSANASVAAFSTAAIPTTMPVASASNAKINKGKVVVQGENVAEQQLQYWFQQADKETQIRFLNWAKSHK